MNKKRGGLRLLLLIGDELVAHLPIGAITPIVASDIPCVGMWSFGARDVLFHVSYLTTNWDLTDFLIIYYYNNTYMSRTI